MDHVHGVHLGRAAETKRAGGRIFTVLSGKGGIGQTNFTLNLGLALGRRTRRTILLDAHANPPAARLLIRPFPRTDADPPAPRVHRLRPPAATLTLGTAPAELCRAADSGFDDVANSRALTHLRRHCDTLLVDGGTGLTRLTSALAQASDLCIWLTTPEPAALAGTYAALKALALDGSTGRMGVVVNMARSRSEAELAADRLASVAQRFLGLTLETIGHVPLDAHVPTAVRQRVPLLVRFPRCPASLHIDAICDALCPAPPDVRRPSRVWAHVASLFL